MNFSTSDRKIQLNDLNIDEAQLIKHILLDWNINHTINRALSLKTEKDDLGAIILNFIGTIDQAVDQVMSLKYNAKVFGAPAKVEHINV